MIMGLLLSILMIDVQLLKLVGVQTPNQYDINYHICLNNNQNMIVIKNFELNTKDKQYFTNNNIKVINVDYNDDRFKDGITYIKFKNEPQPIIVKTLDHLLDRIKYTSNEYYCVGFS